MCLYVKSRDPKSLKFKNGKVTCYKVIRNKNNYSSENVVETKYQCFTLVPGYNYPLGPLKSDDIIGAGAIHVYTNKKKALRKASTDCNHVVIPIICHAVNFIAKGTNEDACFKKIFISKNVHTAAKKAKYKSEIVKS